MKVILVFVALLNATVLAIAGVVLASWGMNANELLVGGLIILLGVLELVAAYGLFKSVFVPNREWLPNTGLIIAILTDLWVIILGLGVKFDKIADIVFVSIALLSLIVATWLLAQNLLVKAGRRKS